MRGSLRGGATPADTGRPACLWSELRATGEGIDLRLAMAVAVREYHRHGKDDQLKGGGRERALWFERFARSPGPSGPAGRRLAG